ncbi:hypothetical protein HKK72_33450, partial [Actinomadura sp. HBU206391]|nr:hypothetical protein [Actinomadura sp. HBU206391]
MTNTAIRMPKALRPPGRALVRRGTLSVLLHRRSAVIAVVLTLVLAAAVVAAIC